MLDKGILREEEIDSFKDSFRKEIEDAFESAKNSPLPKEKDILKYLYKEDGKY